MLRSARLWLAGVAVLALVPAWHAAQNAASAQAGVTTPTPVSPRGFLVGESAIGAGGGRTAVLMSVTSGSGRSRRSSLQARLGGVRGLGAPSRLAAGGESLLVDVGADGTAVAAWREMILPRGVPTVRAALARPGRGFGPVQTLARASSPGTGLGVSGVGVTPTGRAVVAWNRGPDEFLVQVALAPPGGRFGPAQTLGGSQDVPAVAVRPDGVVVVAWLDTTAYVRASTLGTGATVFTTPTDLATPGPGLSLPGVEAVGGPGGAAVTWRRASNERRVAVLGPASSFAASVPLATGGPPGDRDAGFRDHLALALPAGGTAVALWQETRSRADWVVKASSRTAGRAFSPPTTLSASGWLAGTPEAVALPDRALAAWGELRGRQGRVRLAVRPNGRGWTALAPRPARSLNLVAPWSVTAAASSRYAVVTWVQDVDRRTGFGRLYLTTYRP